MGSFTWLWRYLSIGTKATFTGDPGTPPPPVLDAGCLQGGSNSPDGQGTTATSRGKWRRHDERP